MNEIREATFAGSFYPTEPTQLKKMIEQYLKDAPTVKKVPKAIITPHIGYIYSGPIAATVYPRSKTEKQII